MMERPWWQRILYSLWPKINRALNEAIFFVVMVLRTAAKIAIDQIKKI